MHLSLSPKLGSALGSASSAYFALWTAICDAQLAHVLESGPHGKSARRLQT